MVTMETGSVGSVTSYLASLYMVLCLLVVLGFYPFICKASVVCADCSGPGCEHPGSCETDGKCFLRRDVNGLLYRGCADSQRWEGLDLGYNGCRWQHYLGWDYARVLWCLCHKPNCNNVTVGIFMLRDYSVHVQRAVTNVEQPSRDHQDLTKSGPDNEGSTLRGNENISYRNHTHINTRVEWSKESGSENADGELDGRNGDLGLETIRIGMGENRGRDCNMSIILCKILESNHMKENVGSADGDASSRMAPIAFDLNNQKDSGTAETKVQDPSPTALDIASDQFTFGDELKDKGANYNPDDVKGTQDDTGYEHASTTESTEHGENSEDEKAVSLSLGEQSEGYNSETGKTSRNSLDGGSESGLSSAYGARYEMDLDYEAEYADRMEDNGEVGENRELGSPQDGGAKTNNKDYRWLVNTDGSQPYEPIGPIDQLNNGDLSSNQGEPLSGGIGSYEDETDLTKSQTGDGSMDDLSEVREPLPDNLQTGDTEGYKLWDEGVRDGPGPLERQNEDRDGPQFLKHQERVREGPQPLNSQEGALDGSVVVPLDSQVPTVISISETIPSSPTNHPLQTQAKCPSDFKVVPHLHSCYHVDRAPQTWQGAADHCKRIDPRAHLVTIDRPGEYQYIVLKIAMEPKLMQGWQGWWTSGHYDVNIREFTWANNGHVISRLDPKWRHGLIVSPYSGTCVWFVPLAGFKIGNYGCQQPAGAICEIDL